MLASIHKFYLFFKFQYHVIENKCLWGCCNTPVPQASDPDELGLILSCE